MWRNGLWRFGSLSGFSDAVLCREGETIETPLLTGQRLAIKINKKVLPLLLAANHCMPRCHAFDLNRKWTMDLYGLAKVTTSRDVSITTIATRSHP